MTTDFRFRHRVRYGECDPQQVVFNARYGDFIDIGITEYLRHMLGGIQGLNARGLDMMVVKQTKEWQGPARFDDVLEQSIRTGRVGTTSFSILTDFARLPDGAPVMKSETVYVMTLFGAAEKRPIPEDLASLLRHGVPGRLVDHAGPV
ncbi:acyl-CoA thioesterase [Niveispirillum sp.]|uniref:acyl-CoA thioesterase n=1 Tax=Niveispirillum sp. TaxID=1917217 RepID=UPI003BAA06DE